MDVDSDAKITRFEEKPQNPFSKNYGIPYYFVKEVDIEKLKEIPPALRDNSGQIVAQLIKTSEVRGYECKGEIIHLTSEEDYQEISKGAGVEKIS